MILWIIATHTAMVLRFQKPMRACGVFENGIRLRTPASTKQTGLTLIFYNFKFSLFAKTKHGATSLIDRGTE
jgi:hypothetical protein